MMAEVVNIASRQPIKKAFVPKGTGGDELAQIGNPEFLLSEGLKSVHAAALYIAGIKAGEQGEADCIREVLAAFRGPDWVKFAENLTADDGA